MPGIWIHARVFIAGGRAVDRSRGDSRAGALRAARVVRAAIVVVATLASCQSYTPRPLEPVAHRTAWHARTPQDASVADFLGRLDRTLAPGAQDFDPSDGLTLSEGRLVALVFHPELRLARLRADQAAVSAEHAGRWADPELSFSVLKITESVPDPWIVTPGLGFSIPLSGSLGAEEGLADAEHRAF